MTKSKRWMPLLFIAQFAFNAWFVWSIYDLRTNNIRPLRSSIRDLWGSLQSKYFPAIEYSNQTICGDIEQVQHFDVNGKETFKSLERPCRKPLVRLDGLGFHLIEQTWVMHITSEGTSESDHNETEVALVGYQPGLREFPSGGKEWASLDATIELSAPLSTAKLTSTSLNLEGSAGNILLKTGPALGLSVIRDDDTGVRTKVTPDGVPMVQIDQGEKRKIIQAE